MKPDLVGWCHRWEDEELGQLLNVIATEILDEIHWRRCHSGKLYIDCFLIVRIREGGIGSEQLRLLRCSAYSMILATALYLNAVGLFKISF